MGRKVKKDIYWEGVKLHSNINGNEVRVAFDKGYGKNGGYRLYVNNAKIAQCTSKKDIAKLYYGYIDNDNTVKMPAASVKYKKTVEYYIIWVDINRSFEKIEEFISEFIGCLPDDTLEFTLERIKDASERVKEDNKYEPSIFNIKGNEIFICYNNKANKPVLLDDLVNYLNEIYPSRVASDREFLERALLSSGTATKATIEQAKKHWGENNYNIISDDDFKRLMQNHKFEVDGNTICRIEPEIDKDYVIQELGKLLKKDKHSLAALSGIPELAHYDEISIPEKDSDQEK